jgi:predicted small lipoprotein YifL
VGLLTGTAGEHFKQLTLTFGIQPLTVDVFVMKPATLGGQPDLLQGFLQIHNDLAVIVKHQRNHAARTLIVDISIGLLIDTVTMGLNGFERIFSQVQKFNVSHYNAIMKNISQIVNRVATMLAMGLSAAGLILSLTACGQRGPLYLPTMPAGVERASLVDTLTKPSATAPAALPAAPAPVTAPVTATPAK